MHIHPLIELHFYRPMLRCRRVPHPYHCRDVVSRSNNISDAARDLCDCAHHGEERRVEDGERAMQPHGKSLQRCTLTFVVWCSCRGCGAVLRLVRTRLEEAATAHCSLATNLLTPVRVCKAVVSCVLIFFLICVADTSAMLAMAMAGVPCCHARSSVHSKALPVLCTKAAVASCESFTPSTAATSSILSASQTAAFRISGSSSSADSGGGGGVESRAVGGCSASDWVGVYADAFSPDDKA